MSMQKILLTFNVANGIVRHNTLLGNYPAASFSGSLLKHKAATACHIPKLVI
jgi:hypothetical protein